MNRTTNTSIAAGFISEYTLDGEDRLQGVDDGWREFAEQNRGESCLPDRVIGRSLWAFVRDENLRTLYTEIFTEVRRSGRTLEFPFRCDSPEEKRFQRMIVSARGENGLTVRAVVERTEPIERPLVFTGISRGEALLPRCSICLHVKFADRWCSIQDALLAGLLVEQDRPIRVAYSICGECKDSMRDALSRPGS